MSASRPVNRSDITRTDTCPSRTLFPIDPEQLQIRARQVVVKRSIAVRFRSHLPHPEHARVERDLPSETSAGNLRCIVFPSLNLTFDIRGAPNLKFTTIHIGYYAIESLCCSAGPYFRNFADCSADELAWSVFLPQSTFSE